MKVIRPSFVFEDEVDGEKILKKLEKYGRVCYKSEAKITTGSAKKFLKNVIKRGHLSIIEHEKVTVRIICDRGITHEIVRHRVASYSQESTRYCDYSGQIQVIKPFFFSKDKMKYSIWLDVMGYIEGAYKLLRDLGATSEQARSVLPNSLKTEIIVTYNLRQWRHFFRMRCSKGAHPQIREIAIPLLKEFQKRIPVIFDDFEINEEKMVAKTSLHE